MAVLLNPQVKVRAARLRSPMFNIINNPQLVSDGTTYSTTSSSLVQVASYQVTTSATYPNSLVVIVEGYVSSGTGSFEVEVNGAVPSTVLYGSATGTTSSTTSTTVIAVVVPASPNTSYTVSVLASNASSATTYVNLIQIYQAISVTTTGSVTIASITMPAYAFYGDPDYLASTTVGSMAQILKVYYGGAASFTLATTVNGRSAISESVTPSSIAPAEGIYGSAFLGTWPATTQDSVNITVTPSSSGIVLIYRALVIDNPYAINLPYSKGWLLVDAYFTSFSQNVGNNISSLVNWGGNTGGWQTALSFTVPGGYDSSGVNYNNNPNFTGARASGVFSGYTSALMNGNIYGTFILEMDLALWEGVT